jgi:hypothetical protein
MPKFLKELEFVFDVLTLFFLDFEHFDFFDNIELFLFFVSTKKHISWRTKLQRICTLYRWAFLSRINPWRIILDVLIYILNSESYKRRIISYIRFTFFYFLYSSLHFISYQIKIKFRLSVFACKNFLALVIWSLFSPFSFILSQFQGLTYPSKRSPPLLCWWWIIKTIFDRWNKLGKLNLNWSFLGR